MFSFIWKYVKLQLLPNKIFWSILRFLYWNVLKIFIRWNIFIFFVIFQFRFLWVKMATICMNQFSTDADIISGNSKRWLWWKTCSEWANDQILVPFSRCRKLNYGEIKRMTLVMEKRRDGININGIQGVTVFAIFHPQ